MSLSLADEAEYCYQHPQAGFDLGVDQGAWDQFDETTTYQTIISSSSNPQLQTSIKHIRQTLGYDLFRLVHVVASAKVPGDYDFVFEFVFSLNEVIKVHVPVFADKFFTMIGGNEGHFGD